MRPEKARVEYNAAQAQQALEAAIQNMNDSARTRLRDLTFRVDEALGRPVISVVSSKTGDVVRQIPTEVALKVAHQIEDALGVFFDERA